MLPADRRPFVHALYGFARYVDDIIDVSPELSATQRADEFTRWTEDFLADLEWGAASDPVSRAMIDTLGRFEIPHSYVVDFLDSMRTDLTVTSYETFDDLRRYMWGSAAVIGLQLLPILGRRDERVRWDVLESHAIELGIAFQLTNFIRDVGEDLQRGRVYLPQETLDMFGVGTERLRRGVVDESIRSMLAWEIERTRATYAAAAPGIDLVDARARHCLRTAFTLYSEILDEVETADYDVFHVRQHVGTARRATVGLTGLGGALLARHRADRQ